MQVPQFGKAPNLNAYQPLDSSREKKKKWLLIGGGVLVVFLLIIVFSSGNTPPGEPQMKQAVQSTSEALGIVNSYNKNLSSSQAKNNIALVQILLRGNYQNINALYTKTYKPKKRFSNSGKLDTTSAKTLDAAVRNNLIDSSIADVLKPKVTQAETSLIAAQQFFKNKSSLEKIQSAEKDLTAISDLLQQTTIK